MGWNWRSERSGYADALSPSQLHLRINQCKFTPKFAKYRTSIYCVVFCNVISYLNCTIVTVCRYNFTSLTHSLTPQLTHSLTHSLARLTHSLTHSLTRTHSHSLAHSLTRSLAFTHARSRAAARGQHAHLEISRSASNSSPLSSAPLFTCSCRRHAKRFLETKHSLAQQTEDDSFLLHRK